MVTTLLLLCALAQSVRVSAQGVPCNIIPAAGCFCYHLSYKGTEVSCHNLGLTAMPTFSPDQLVEIDTIQVTGNHIQELGENAFKNALIRKLYLSGNELATIHPEAFSTSAGTLTHFDLSNNNLTEIPSAVKQLAALKTLVLTNNAITVLDCDVIIFYDNALRLNSLYLHQNPIVDMRSCFFTVFYSIALEKLTISLKAYEPFYAYDNPLVLMPLIITAQLKVFELRDTNLALNYPDFYRTVFPKLEYIAIEGCHLLSFQDAEVDSPVAARLRGLSLTNNDLLDVPTRQLSLMHNLEFLDLSRNQISTDIVSVSLPKMRSLNLSNNAITYVWIEDFEMPALQVLDLSNNQLSGLGVGLIPISNLYSVYIAGNPWDCDCDLAWLVALVQWDADDGMGPFSMVEMFGRSGGLRCAGQQFTDVLFVDVVVTDIEPC